MPHLVEQDEPKSRSTKGLKIHRTMLEVEGNESGRDVHAKYRQELIQMKHEMAETGAKDGKDNAPSAFQAWVERAGEKLGDFLAEPGPALIVIGVIVLALTFAIVFGILLQ